MAEEARKGTWGLPMQGCGVAFPQLLGTVVPVLLFGRDGQILLMKLTSGQYCPEVN